MNNIKLSDISAVSETLDHHGIVAGCCEDLEIAKKIDKLLYGSTGVNKNRVVSAGLASVAMIINGLGFTNRRLYLTSQFFETKPVSILLNRANIKASDITDDTLGKALDEIALYGVDKLFGNIATEIALEHNLLDRLFHVDTTSISTTGEYADTCDESEYVEITYGKSKDNKPDCKQVIMSLVVNGGNGIPLWMSPKDGNASDKKTLYDTIKAVKDFCVEIDTENNSKWVADSALYNQNNLLKDNSFLWLSRVPETIKEAKELICNKRDGSWIMHDNGYKTKIFSSNYGGIKQKWLLVYSEVAYNREIKTFNRNLEKQAEQLKKDLWHFGNDEFKCHADLKKALDKLKNRYKYYTIEGVIAEIKKYEKAGKPRIDEVAKATVFQYKGSFVKNLSIIEAELNKKGKFILATNDLDSTYTNEQILSDYKEQHHVEQGFRFLKDPWFMVSSIFLKSRKRVAALMMIMALCLLVYNFAQYKLRKKLEEANETVPNQVKKQIKNPTMRWVFQLMEGIHIVYFKLKNTNQVVQESISNLDDVRTKIIRLFGGYTSNIYRVTD